MAGLSAEDTLRLNVLLAKQPQAIRIDESKMTIFALTDSGEKKIVLAPQTDDSSYLKLVRQFLSSHVFGSPGGYPVYLKRWTRMGQARSQQSLKKLLLLGEPEALAAVVCSPDLDTELAEYAWWASENAEHGRRMLACPCVAQSKFATVLADFLIEFLPFETEPRHVIDSVRLVLQEGLISNAVRTELWRKGEKKSIYYVGFLLAAPDKLLDTATAHADYTVIENQLSHLPDNPFAQCLLRMLSGSGQQFMQTTAVVINKATNQDVCICLFEAIEKYFLALELNQSCREISEIEAECARIMESNPRLQELTAVLPDAEGKIEAMLALSMVSDSLLDRVFGLTDSSGSVMRGKIRHITDPIRQWLTVLNPNIAALPKSGRRK